MPLWLYILLVVLLLAGVLLAWRRLRPNHRTLFWIVVVIVIVALFGFSIAVTVSLAGHKATVKVGPGPTATTTRTTAAPAQTAPTGTTPAPSTNTTTTTSTSTTPMSPSQGSAGGTTGANATPTGSGTANPAAPTPPPASAGSPTTSGQTAGAPPAQQYPMDGKAHVFVDLNDYVHDGQLANFSFKIVNGTNQPLPYTRAAVLMSLDGMGLPKWTPIYNLQGAEFQYYYWWVRTATIAPGAVVTFTGMVPIPDRTKINSTAATACLYGLLQVNYPGKPNATLESKVKSEKPSCSEYSAIGN